MQKRYSFDKETIIKIGKGALIALTGSAALGLLDYLGQLQIDNPAFAAFMVWIVPVATNTIKEWVKGK
jgi:hypothetical protein